ncbi:hypothetical protein POTOM_061858 [Populus tomentosa]|uniref:Uncharacterized protein n=1 Tax=Populus tomentosa TaxID=118781 RepID=A0A8X8BZH0_POPTO|nr:hypothetical protein POTOM_061858 [Populus tomentosa]
MGQWKSGVGLTALEELMVDVFGRPWVGFGEIKSCFCGLISGGKAIVVVVCLAMGMGLFQGCFVDVLWWLVPVVKMGDDRFVLAVKGEGDRERDSPGDVDLDETITCIPGLEGTLRCRDLPSICRCKEANHPLLQFIIKETEAMPRASGLILNTFDSLEASMVSVRKRALNCYCWSHKHCLVV